MVFDGIKLEKRRIMNLPNILTLMRILIIPLIVIFLFFPGKIWSLFAALSFLVASFTDLLDGFFARRYNIVTSFGKFFDPIADKLLIASALIMLIPLRGIPAWMVVIIIGREIAVSGLRGVASANGVIVEASWLGKRKTFFQMTSLFCLLVHYEYFYVNFHIVGMFFLWIAVLLTLWSGSDYFYKFIKGKVSNP
jgi:CDP-diacylglycerol--glycerol-3-phosphate 3-phosphatidyltransferase